MKYLVFTEYEIKEIEWKNPKIIDVFWFGDTIEDAKSASQVYPDTEITRKELENLRGMYEKAREVKEKALRTELDLIEKYTKLKVD